MLRTKDALVCGLLLWGHHARAAPPSNAVGDTPNSRHPDAVDASSQASGRRRLTGRFLHITGTPASPLIAHGPRLPPANVTAQTSIPTHSTRHTRAPQPTPHAIASVAPPASTEQKQPAATRPLLWSTRRSSGYRTTSKMTLTLSSGPATRRATTTTSNYHAPTSRLSTRTSSWSPSLSMSLGDTSLAVGPATL